MKKSAPAKALALLLALATFHALTAANAAAQRRDHLTPEEIELIRDNQELDKRTEVFIKAAERRLLALTDSAAAAKQLEKDTEKWGVVKGTREQLLYDISKILDEAVVNIDDAHLHSPDSPLLRKSLFKLSEAAARFLPQLAPLRQSTQSEKERDILERAIESVEEIVEAAKSHNVNEGDLKAKSNAKKNN
ncbi:MAG TPA: hypothetical protein VD968_18470 [Pyrinomonadaceae bacterium]|nr:hypothetical protein [Pyrinomonadaceae bacterium]